MNTLPKVQHIDPRDPRMPVVCEAMELSDKMRRAQTTPYRFIRKGMACMVNGDYQQGFAWLDYAQGFVDVFWAEKSMDNQAFSHCIKLMKMEFMFLADKFSCLKPEE
jgi:hypothetical protein